MELSFVTVLRIRSRTLMLIACRDGSCLGGDGEVRSSRFAGRAIDRTVQRRAPCSTDEAIETGERRDVELYETDDARCGEYFHMER